MVQKVCNTQALILCGLSLLLNGIFLYFNSKTLFTWGLLKHQGDIAYNLYEYNSIKVTPTRMVKLMELEAQQQRRVDYYEINPKSYGPPTEYRNYCDSIGYGIVIGLLWKLTNSLDFLDIQLLQILLFSLLLLLFYQIAFMLFNQRTALFSTLALLLFFPITYLNVQVARDIWPYYSAVILAYTALSYILNKSSFLIPLTGGIFIALFQFMRPPTFTLILTSSLVLCIYAVIKKSLKPFSYVIILWLTNICFFWIPFATYNKIAYDRYMVAPTGINLLEGLGEIPNPWGYKLNDPWYLNFMKTTYPQLTTDLERDDKARELFFAAIKEQPQVYLQQIMKRVPRIIFPGLPCFGYYDNQELYHLYLTGTPISKIIASVMRSPTILLDFAIRHIYIGLFLFLAYLGMLLMLIRRKFFPFFFIFIGLIAPCFMVIFSHTDHRYLIPFYAFFALFVGYLFAEIKKT
jgi:hypothetical protein